ncbi:butyrophilin subfamily 1 member A1-like isoform X3 [Lepisosteus oculatus]|uniref:butyrophilin subfamily 1 member A1-like isoform X3 n=1 Tax=Lepisosteus oculatus TaxID=7918 RepID=UPI00371311BF
MGNSAVACAVLLLFLTSFVRNADSKQEFKLIVPSEPVVASVDSDIVLPCQLSPEMSATAMEVRWFKENFDNLVFLYKEGKEKEGSDYRGRVRLFRQEMETGNVSLLLQNVRISEQGIYKCHVSNVDWYEEPQMQLRVTRKGSSPEIEISKFDKDIVKLSCHSEGWYPEPQMFWTDKGGRKLSSVVEPVSQPSKDSPYSVTSHLNVERTNSHGVDCVVTQQQQRVQLESRMKVNDEFFKSTHPVRLYLSVIIISIVLALLCFCAAFLYAKKKNQDAQRKLKEYDRVEKELHSLQKVHGNQTDLLDAVRQIPNSVWNRICESKVEVTLDPKTAQATLSVSEGGKTVTLGERQADSDGDNRFEQALCVLGMNVFTTGRHYWEVEVGEKTQWSVGVAEGSAKRSGKVIIRSERGFWALRLSDEKFYAATNPDTLLPLSLKPRKLGVYLDYEGGQVSFYNVEARVHIYTFSDSFTEGLHPFFGTEKQCRKPLTISPVDREAASDQPWAQIKAQTEALYKKSPEAAETDTSQTHQEKDKKKEKEGKSSEAPSDTPVQTADYKNLTFSYKNECQSEETAAPPALEDNPEASSPAGPGGTGTAEEKDTEKSRDSACEETALLEKRESGGPAGGETGELGTTPTGKDKSKGGKFSLFPKKSK